MGTCMTQEERLMLREVLLLFRVHSWRDRDGTAVSLSRALLRRDCTPRLLASLVHRSFLQVNHVTRERVVVVLSPLLEETR